MKEFIQTINEIRQICSSCMSCAECPLATHTEHYHYCYFSNDLPRYFDGSDILKLMEKWRG